MDYIQVTILLDLLWKWWERFEVDVNIETSPPATVKRKWNHFPISLRNNLMNGFFCDEPRRRKKKERKKERKKEEKWHYYQDGFPPIDSARNLWRRKVIVAPDTVRSGGAILRRSNGLRKSEVFEIHLLDVVVYEVRTADGRMGRWSWLGGVRVFPFFSSSSSSSSSSFSSVSLSVPNPVRFRRVLKGNTALSVVSFCAAHCGRRRRRCRRPRPPYRVWSRGNGVARRRMDSRCPPVSPFGFHSDRVQRRSHSAAAIKLMALRWFPHRKWPGRGTTLRSKTNLLVPPFSFFGFLFRCCQTARAHRFVESGPAVRSETNSFFFFQIKIIVVPHFLNGRGHKRKSFDFLDGSIKY